ncbi:ATP-binding protein [Olivibacter sp. 47]|uniref:ATP-binding protein n=1 Tax=Olivibacter sp. 47 TaxID=3056486 RepID=UPI00338D9935
MFSDRIEITSAGTLPEGLSVAESFDGVSIPRNRELMRVYRDLELVEQLGSGVPKILESSKYPPKLSDCWLYLLRNINGKNYNIC